METTNPIHFHSGDDRFCGSTASAREFSLDPNEITCPSCGNKDTFILSDEAREFVAAIENAKPLRGLVKS